MSNLKQRQELIVKLKHARISDVEYWEQVMDCFNPEEIKLMREFCLQNNGVNMPELVKQKKDFVQTTKEKPHGVRVISVPHGFLANILVSSEIFGDSEEMFLQDVEDDDWAVYEAYQGIRGNSSSPAFTRRLEEEPKQEFKERQRGWGLGPDPYGDDEPPTGWID